MLNHQTSPNLYMDAQPESNKLADHKIKNNGLKFLLGISPKAYTREQTKQLFFGVGLFGEIKCETDHHPFDSVCTDEKPIL